MVISNKKNIEIFELTREILNEHPNGYYSALIWGKKGRGKSAYCIHVMKQLFLQLSLLHDEIRYEKLEYDISIDEAYDMALDHMVFDIVELLDKCRQGKGGLKDPRKMIPVLTFDDAGVGASSYLFWSDKELAGALKGYNDILRRRITGFLVNTPHTKGLLSFIRDEEDLGVPLIKCTKEYKWERLATAKIKKEGRIHKVRVFQDEFSCYLPKKVYTKYVDMTDEAFDKQEELIDNLIIERRKRFPDKSIPEEWQRHTFDKPI